MVKMKSISSDLKTEICGIIQYYDYLIDEPNTLWEIICDDLDIDYDDEFIGNFYEELLLEYKK
jgi:hypothetical protein